MKLNRTKFIDYSKKRYHIFLITLLVLTMFSSSFFVIPTTACHNVDTYENDYQTPKDCYLKQESVYGKETYGTIELLCLRIRDPNDNVVYTSNPNNGYEITCEYLLDNDAPYGEWSIQVGIFNNGWQWLQGPGDIETFQVIDPEGDSTPPETTLAIGEPYIQTSCINWATSDSLLILTSTDHQGSGVKELWYTYTFEWMNVMDNMVEFNIPDEGAYILGWFAIDNNNNIEEIRKESIIIDNTPPVTWIVDRSYLPYLYIYAFDCMGSENCLIHYKEFTPDGGESEWMESIPPLRISDPPKTIAYYAEDALGNHDSVQEYEWGY